MTQVPDLKYPCFITLPWGSNVRCWRCLLPEWSLLLFSCTWGWCADPRRVAAACFSFLGRLKTPPRLRAKDQPSSHCAASDSPHGRVSSSSQGSHWAMLQRHCSRAAVPSANSLLPCLVRWGKGKGCRRQGAPNLPLTEPQVPPCALTHSHSSVCWMLWCSAEALQPGGQAAPKSVSFSSTRQDLIWGKTFPF